MRFKATGVTALSLGPVEAFAGTHSKALGVTIRAAMTILHLVGSSHVVSEAALASLLACRAALESSTSLEPREGCRSTDTTGANASSDTTAAAGVAGSATGSSTVATSAYSTSSSTKPGAAATYSTGGSTVAGSTASYCTGSSTSSSTVACSATAYSTGGSCTVTASDTACSTGGSSTIAASDTAYSTSGSSTVAASDTTSGSTEAASVATSYTTDSSAISTRARWADSRNQNGAGNSMKQSSSLYFAVILLLGFLFHVRGRRRSSREEHSS